MTARILWTSSQTLGDIPDARGIVMEILAAFKAQEFFKDATFVHGNAKGGDTIGASVWEELGGATEAHPADWPRCVRGCKPSHRRWRRDGTSFCPTAGKRRNQHMVNLGADLCIRVHVNDSPGSRMTARMAEAADIRLIEIEVFPPDPEGVPPPRYLYSEAAVSEPYRQED